MINEHICPEFVFMSSMCQKNMKKYDKYTNMKSVKLNDMDKKHKRDFLGSNLQCVLLYTNNSCVVYIFGVEGVNLMFKALLCYFCHPCVRFCRTFMLYTSSSPKMHIFQVPKRTHSLFGDIDNTQLFFLKMSSMRQK